MSSQVVIELAGQADETIDIAEGDAVLVGREPEADKLGALGEGHVRTVAMTVPSVSANHLVVRRDGDTMTLVDAASRNGSWLRLPPGDRVEVRSKKVLQMRIAVPPALAERTEGPKDATWTDRNDFHIGVGAAVRAWFDALGLAVRVTTSPPDRPFRDDRTTGRLPLENGYRLEVVPTRTAEASWGDTLQALWRYVDSQNAIFSSEEETRDEGMILASPAIRRAHRQVVTAAQRGLRVLLIGPSGSGKDGLARCYHRHSRRGGAFVAKNCSMLNRDFLRAELFGADKGAFTSAVQRIVGAVEASDGGTLFLDEIGEMPIDVQPALLKFLDRGEYERMGSYNTLRSADVRLVCATNKDLRAATIRGDFRDDLWYRIAGEVVQVPPLRDRPEDIEAFLRAQLLDQRVDPWSALDGDARRLVLDHAWAGNFRELTAFAMRVPRDVTPQSIGAPVCRALLDEVALAPPSAAAASRPAADGSASSFDIGRLSGEATRHFIADYGHDLRRWDDVKECIERYLKPLLFAALSGACSLERREDAVIPELADAIDADRGTVLKQLNRYFERFRK
jgi:DNA-binding NtrC family response regulator/pSer/pThr/pTyr-binding forkhead associated (FHA) protein